MAELEIDHLTLRFGGLTVLDDVSLAVGKGELLALIGPNGAGKTSVLNCISGLYRGDGSIRFAGEDITGRAPHEIAQRGIARTFQHGELFPQMTVVENLLTGRHARIRTNALAEMLFLPGVRRQELLHRQAIERVIELVELERYRYATVGTLPFGIQKIVGFARALAMEPKVLLLDEPCTGLIREERENLARFLLRIVHELKPTIIWVEHDMQMVSDLADRVVVMNHGAKVTEGPPLEVRQNPEVVRAYLGQSPVR
jgi:branched-chain amino acid transport system ATP-binding protein